MSTNDSPQTSNGPSSLAPLELRSRRGSLASASGSTAVDKEQLALALDKIHSTASHSETLTTFNEFASPPPPSANTESKGLAGDIMQNGLSGLYSRFRGAVAGGKEKAGPSSMKGDHESTESVSVKSQATPTPNSKSTLPPTREDSGVSASPAQLSTSSSRLQSPTASSFAGQSSESQSQTLKSSKTSFTPATTPATTKSASSTRPVITPMTKATTSFAIVPTLAPVNVSAFKDGDSGRTASDQRSEGPPSTATSTTHEHPPTFGFDPRKVGRASDDLSVLDDSEGSDDRIEAEEGPGSHVTGGGDGSLDPMKRPLGGSKSASSALSSLQATDTRANASSRNGPDGMKRPAAIERITQSHLPGYQASRASSTDRSTAETSPINTSAHNSVRHESFSVDDSPQLGYLGRLRIPGTTTNEGAPEAVNARLEQMRKQVLSKEFWMADDICKECFLCGDAFSAFRRKHHCRTCGCIFDSKCTSIISGQRFGVQGSLRVCKTCLDIINRRHDSSGSDDSADDSVLPTFFQTQQAKYEASSRTDSAEAVIHGSTEDQAVGGEISRPLATPMMAIPATRRIGESTNRRSAILEIDAPQLSRPSSSRSLKALSAAGRPPSSGHKRHHSKHNFLGRFKPTAEERAPFHRGVADDLGKKTKLPAFHDDNIIDPDLAPYMSDEESSADEQMSIFATLNSGSVITPSFENDRSGFGSLLSSSKKHRARAGEKSVSGVSFTSRGLEDISGSASAAAFSRPNRRRNLSTTSASLHHSRTSPRQPVQGFGNLDEESIGLDQSSTASTLGPSKVTRSASMRDAKAPAIELNNASLHHVRRMLHQMLEDANIPNVSSWEKALIPILLQCTDDVNPNVRLGDDIDIRHYVKLKKIPGGKPGDTTYVSGVVFTKNLALKSMPRSISNPRIVIVSFPIEYQRHQHHFMSLEPVIAQEKEFLRNMVNRIASLRPQLLLVQKHISGLALQYLAEANIAVAYNVKQSVIEAVSRFARTEIISSIDMVALKPVHVGKSGGFDVKTYVHNDIPGKKKTYIYLSGCPKDLGCTIALRGANMATLSKMKRITEFMVYVVYNLKLETCLMRDEFVLIPSVAENSDSLSPSRQQSSHAIQGPEVAAARDTVAAASDKLQAVVEAGKKFRQMTSSDETGNGNGANDDSRPISANINVNSLENSQSSKEDGSKLSVEAPKFVSAHESHAHVSHEDQLPEDIPMPTFYSDMVAKHQTKILSASPFVKFVQPYLLMKAREQERRLVYLRRLRDQDTFEEHTDTEKSKAQKFQLIKPEMVHETVKRAPRQIMEVLHAVHDAEYDKALHNYQTQKRQWENYIQGNLNLFDPYAHQNITVLYTVVCTATSIPCAGPELLALAFYNEHAEFDPDCTLGQYVEDLCLSVNTICTSNGCERKMSEHHRTYVHGEARITVFVEKSPCKIKGLQDSILMWSYCKICQKETQIMPMSESTWKYSLGKYLELSFWSSELRLRAGVCPHDIHRDHLRYFGFRNVAIRIHYDPIDLLEIIVPRTRVTWKVDNDLKLKNELFTKYEERWNRFMTSVHSRIKGINIDSVSPEKAEACKVEVERLTRRAQEEHAALIRKLQEKYMESKYYEIIPLNRAVRAMQEKVAEWDDAFADFDANFFPSEKDIRRLAALQLKKMFMDRDESSTTIGSTEGTDLASDIDEKSPHNSLELSRNPSNVSAEEAHDVLTSVVEENSMPTQALTSEKQKSPSLPAGQPHVSELEREGIQHLDLAFPTQSEATPSTLAGTPVSTDNSCPMSPNDSDISSLPFSELPLESTLSEKVERLRKANSSAAGEPSQSEHSGIPRPSERGASRRSGIATSPPLNRTQSQPAGTLRRVHANNKTPGKLEDNRSRADSGSTPLEALKPSATEPAKPTDKKLSERLGLNTLKTHRKAGHSLIPRSVHGKRKESKVSTLAKHFEQLSREFEKERLRDRKQRAAKVTQSRAFPKASSKPIVEVYKDVNEAVEERGPSDEALLAVQPTHPADEVTSVVGGLAELNAGIATGHSGAHSPTDTAVTADETATETDDNQQNVSQTGSDDDGPASDIEHSLLDDIIPGAAAIAESLRAGKPSDMPLDIPKHEKTSLMKMLTNFWAERSASGWTPLEYPINAGDHIFADIDVIVREDEPSSLIAFTLQTQDYRDKLADIRSQGRASSKREARFVDADGDIPDICQEGMDQAEVETSLLRATGTHLAYSFMDGSARMQCKIFFAEQFDAVRRKCGVSDRIVESLSRCLKWDSKGGKTKSVFLKTLDERLVVKSLSPIETQAFLKFAPAYFNIMAEALFHDLPTVIAKMLGFYQIIIKNPVTGTEIKWDVLVMENLFYDRSPSRIFDLKGSMRNRKIQSTGEQNEVLLDENMVEFIYESPLFAREHSKKLLRAAIFNDTLFLQRNDVMDYSLMVAVDEARKELVVGIIDVVRTYTWDKKLESWIKDRGFAGGGRNRPTVTSPKEYKSRFREAMDRYILQAPNSWHQWQPIEAKPQREPRKETAADATGPV
ncbi:1-phosphatidylinositol-3-phosphate 5-kinase-like protein FAB1 [Hyaloscypha variabilis F]|uniref:1-phosphatidylinositol-3-phosphate 5-kinase n=1 Tax=Hyaloscypha variabilis (strain UAMH 11265 / GT02V1 / F) TaxID=1149755 RepID=A0A2J6R5G1_HYAVF|nr:1-phosphatidylinositol-3-phosphate 5-kinase-like protein FAB1 [Hyaloscypha variabilis F]